MIAATLQVGSHARAHVSLGAAQPIARIGWAEGSVRQDTQDLKDYVRFSPLIAPLDMQAAYNRLQGVPQLFERMLFFPTSQFAGSSPRLHPVHSRVSMGTSLEFKLSAFETLPPTRIVERDPYSSQVYRFFRKAALDGKVLFEASPAEDDA